MWLILILLVLAITGTLWAVLKVAVGVAVGLFLGFVLIAGLIAWRVRKALRGPQERWRRVPGSSRIEVLRPGDDQ
ncbi:MAG: hypothetical protein H0W27_09110 [Actinobacteria bacterium]|nr:hypothetical protein [Actinomycetota bacterium]